VSELVYHLRGLKAPYDLTIAQIFRRGILFHPYVPSISIKSEPRRFKRILLQGGVKLVPRKKMAELIAAAFNMREMLTPVSVQEIASRHGANKIANEIYILGR
jgi:hypothetical protein